MKADDLKQLVNAIADERGLDLRGYRHNTLERRIRKRMFQLGIGSYPDYLEKIRSDAREVNELLNTVLINVTEFFRDPQAWEALGAQVLTPLLSSLAPGETFRAWSAGCASGEEPYSLAILIAEHLGERLPQYDIKIYGTDIDEDALNVARRGEYPCERLRRVRPEWREKYFAGSTQLRVSREIRRTVIYGRSSLITDAPISRCQLVLCRNVLIYFDTATQSQILKRLHYALEPGGALFLGKAESRLAESHVFRPVNPRWRIFQRVDSDARLEDVVDFGLMPQGGDDKLQKELRALRRQHSSLLEALKSGVILLDERDCIVSCNEAAVNIFNLSNAAILNKKRLQQSEIAFHCPELAARLEENRRENTDIRFTHHAKLNGDERCIDVTIRQVLAGDTNERIGTIIYCNDVTTQERLQTTVEQLQATGEELQSANEELETTNEELQSTNEELETTNEELQSTNEELETTNEELQSLNEELENMNEELEARSLEMKTLTTRYADTLKRMPWPLILVDNEETIQVWNAAAQRLFGVGETSVTGVKLDKLPIQEDLRRALVRRVHGVLERKRPAALREPKFRFAIDFTPMNAGDGARLDGVLVMFGPELPAAKSPQTETATRNRGVRAVPATNPDPPPLSSRKKKGPAPGRKSPSDRG